MGSPPRLKGLVELTIDASQYAEHASPAVFLSDLDELVHPDLRNHYSGPICASRWIQVCADSRYGHADHLRRAESVLPGLVDTMRRHRTADVPAAVVSLGPGDGSLDVCVLRALDASIGVAGYCGVDSSYDLLLSAAHRFCHEPAFRRPFSMRAVCADFTKLTADAPGLEFEPGKRLFLLTGLTLGNHAERPFLEQLRGILRPGDLLLVDARVHALGRDRNDSLAVSERAALMQAYDLDSVRRFVFGPVEMATYANADSSVPHIEVARNRTTVPSAFNVLLYCRNLETTMRLTGAPVRRDRIDLAVTTLYDFGTLRDWFAGAGFGVVWSGNVDGLGMFLLELA